MWNDGKSGNTPYDFIPAHSKFFMAVNSDLSHGFAISHSFPKYPEVRENGSISVHIHADQKRNGQHAFCFTLDSKTKIEQIMSNANYIQPNLDLNTITQLSGSSEVNESDFKDASMTIGQEKLRIFWQNGWSRSKRKDIFKEIAVSLNAKIWTHTWATAKNPPFPSECGFKSSRTGKILNIDNIGDLAYGGKDISLGAQPGWTERNDHSKWIVSNDENYACLGDLNRNSVEQEVRGGAFYCLKSPRLAKMFKQIIYSTVWGTCYWDQQENTAT